MDTAEEIDKTADNTIKTHILTFAKHFMKGHPKEGEPTGFATKIVNGTSINDIFHIANPARKIHTIRSNYDYWLPRIQNVRHKEAYLSCRYWEGKPYQSKQYEFVKIFGNDKNKPSTQSIYIGEDWSLFVDKSYRTTIDELAKNDGLSIEDFKCWFKDKLPFSGIIIHFTDFRY